MLHPKRQLHITYSPVKGRRGAQQLIADHAAFNGNTRKMSALLSKTQKFTAQVFRSPSSLPEPSQQSTRDSFENHRMAFPGFRSQPVACAPPTPVGIRRLPTHPVPSRTLTCGRSAVRPAGRLLHLSFAVGTVLGGGRPFLLVAGSGGLGALTPHGGCGRREAGVRSARGSPLRLRRRRRLSSSRTGSAQDPPATAFLNPAKSR